ncbi:hypothetical protein CRV08_03755 [Halarcobacter ebronensis]|uniref:Uncharacterized protein n=1 Tax=Halarcobacter ebronensis TaxID=1462615 RepID=A0A4Q0YF26_9BACT|nr:hypothetical protein [Halarcobacter ebronensis]RXJ69137.1 hypothetical protein CRV08_03755 [Halarcobacter ebronensis]
MNIFLLNDIIVFLFIEIILVVLMLISEFSVIKILRKWDFNVTTSLQYSLEKRNYLVNTIIDFTIIGKIVLFIFFIKTLAELSHVVPGAMCIAGVVGANDYGEVLLLLKIFIVFMLAVWLIINRLDLKSKRFVYIKKKYLFFNFLLLLVLIELLAEVLYFSNIPLKVPVFCCSTIFKADALPFGLDRATLALAFYIIFAVTIVVSYLKKIILSFLLNAIFLFSSYFAVTYFFSIYIYVLPNHQCPFCILQKEYFYIGYFIWISLFLGVFFGIAAYVVESIIKIKETTFFKYSILFNTIFTAICSYFVLIYYIKNGVFL